MNSFCAQKNAEVRSKYAALRVSDDRFFVALNLHDNHEIVPDLIVELYHFIVIMGPSRFFVSVYESGSSDQTKTFVSLFRTLLDEMGVPNLIETSIERRPSNLHRIEYLARVRNRVMHPLYDSRVNSYTKVLFLNDVLMCASDMFELVRQANLNGADMTCGLDYDMQNWQVGFYDTWVARDANGNMFDKGPLFEFVRDEGTKERLKRLLPFQVQCCWNGMAVLNAQPFYPPFETRFRRDLTKDLAEDDVKTDQMRGVYPDEKLYETCSGSEISQLCNDFYSHGFKKAIIVPQVGVAYEWETYRRVQLALEMQLEENEQESDMAELVDFKPAPMAAQCYPMDGNNLRTPDGELGRVLLI